MFQNITQIVKNNLLIYCLYCFHAFITKNKLELDKRVIENKDFCNVIMPSEDIKILEFNQYQKSGIEPLIIYADLECIIEKIDGSKINLVNLSTTKVSEHFPSGFSISFITSFRKMKSKHNVSRGKDFMKTFCTSLR